MTQKKRRNASLIAVAFGFASTVVGLTDWSISTEMALILLLLCGVALIVALWDESKFSAAQTRIRSVYHWWHPRWIETNAVLLLVLLVPAIFLVHKYEDYRLCLRLGSPDVHTELRIFHRIHSALGIALQKLNEYEEQVRRVMLDESLRPEDLETDRLDRIITELEREAHRSRYFSSVFLRPRSDAYDPRTYDGYASTDLIRPTAEEDAELHQKKSDRIQREFYRIMLTHENFAEIDMELEDLILTLEDCGR